MSSNIVNSQLGQSSPQTSKHMSISMPTQSTIAEESSLDQYNKGTTTPQSYSCSVSSGSSSSTISNNNTQLEITQQPQQPQPQQKQPPPNSPSRAKKLVDKFATFTPRAMKNKSDRQLIVETAYCNRNTKKDGTQSEQRSNKAENMKPSKKKKRAPINITEGMSRADIFAANVASAVDAAEDADEEEDYIYSNDHSRTPSMTSLSSGMPQLHTFSFPHMPSDSNYGYPYHVPPNMYGAIPNPHRPYGNYLHRPPFYGFYSNTSDDVASNHLNRNGSQNSLNNPNAYKPTGVMRSSLPDMSQYVFQYKKGYHNYGSTNYPYNAYNDWYGDEERLPLFAPNYETRQRQSCIPTMSSLTVIIVFLLASSYLFYFASTRPLTEVSITGISDVLAADKELMFNIHVKGRNFGLWNIEIVKADLTVFATPIRNNIPGGIPGGPGSHWDDIVNEPINEVTPSQLGRIFIFDEPLVFDAGFNKTGVMSETSGQVRLQNPGGNDKEGQERWSYIIRRQYDLTVRGVLKYSLPFSKQTSVRVCYVTRVDGGSDSNVEDDDHNDKFTSNNDNVILGACGDWEKEQDKTDMSD
ncbi:hypothetical protein C1645_817571 [Glomus cerebriforme]|uniref:Vacuolar segregation subunit 7-domain-containing protein n=1 Tax=Glomus cerebriforme TaxID=658196 RepID=A0A397TE58_9GLOM|nr:hypothetical protein C1645_817571 [Glomus cerebriforme]